MLYIVATPIGNPQDISLHALEVLKNVEAIACEDTRVTNRLLSHHGIHASMIVYNDHSHERERQKIINRMNDGQSIALVSDAGTPLISDPGYKLIQDIREQGYKVVSLPGASAVTTALTLSGLPSDKFCFHGFLPHKQKARQNELEALKAWPVTHIFFESPRRLTATIADMHIVLGTRDACVLRELTKYYEECRQGTLEELAQFYNENPDVKGEIVIVVAPASHDDTMDEETLDTHILKALETMRLKEAVAFVVEHTGENKKQVYERALVLSGKK